MSKETVILVISSLLLMSFIGCTSKSSSSPAIVVDPSPGKTIIISGTVKSTSGRQIPDARAVATPKNEEEGAKRVEASTNNMGKYIMELVPYSYNIKVTCSGYSSAETTKILAMDLSDIDFTLKPLSSFIVRVYDKDNMTEPTAEATVSITEMATNKAVTVTSVKDNGEFHAIDILPGKYLIFARSNRKNARTEYTVEEGGEIPIELILKADDNGATSSGIGQGGISGSQEKRRGD